MEGVRAGSRRVAVGSGSGRPGWVAEGGRGRGEDTGTTTITTTSRQVILVVAVLTALSQGVYKTVHLTPSPPPSVAQYFSPKKIPWRFLFCCAPPPSGGRRSTGRNSSQRYVFLFGFGLGPCQADSLYHFCVDRYRSILLGPISGQSGVKIARRNP